MYFLFLQQQSYLSLKDILKVKEKRQNLNLLKSWIPFEFLTVSVLVIITYQERLQVGFLNLYLSISSLTTF